MAMHPPGRGAVALGPVEADLVAELDDVARQLFSAGFRLQKSTYAAPIGEPALRWVDAFLDDLDKLIRRVRAKIVEMTDADTPGIVDALVGIVGRVAERSMVMPSVRFVGPVECLSPDAVPLIGQVLSEMVANLVRGGVTDIDIGFLATDGKLRVVASEGAKAVRERAGDGTDNSASERGSTGTPRERRWLEWETAC